MNNLGGKSLQRKEKKKPATMNSGKRHLKGIGDNEK